MNLKKILNKEATWYFVTLAGLLILLYMGGNIIIDTYFYVISLNILIFLNFILCYSQYMGANVIIDTYFYMTSLSILILLFSYIIFKIKNKLHYYSYVVGCAFLLFGLSFIAYAIWEAEVWKVISPNNSRYCFIFQQVLKEGGPVVESK